MIAAVWNEAHRAHAPTVRAHLGAIEAAQDVAARGEALHAALAGDPAVTLHPPDELDLGPVLAVHDAELVDFLANVVDRWQALGLPLDRPAIVPWAFPSPRLATAGPLPVSPDLRAQVGEFCIDTLTVVLPGTWAAALSAAHAAATAARLVASGTPLGYAAVRPPGHHAGPRTYGGACFLNNAAVAAQHLAADGRRVAIVDVDAHHGNGTQEIFYAREDVFFASLHADPAHEYPYWRGFTGEHGSGAGLGTTRNEPLPPGCDDRTWLAALERLLAAVDEFRPDMVVVSLGVDGLAQDENSFLDLTPTAFAAAGRLVGGLRRPVVCVQEGGYVLPLLGETVLAFLHAAAAEL